MGMTYTRVVRLPNAYWSVNSVRPEGVIPSGLDHAGFLCYRQRMVISRPTIMKLNPTAKFHAPRSDMNEIDSPAR